MTTGIVNPLSRTFRYGGMAMPFGPQLKDYFEVKSDRDVLRTSIMTILLTMFGERVMLCDFGSNLMELVFEQSDEVLQRDLTSIVKEVVPRWDPRLEVLSATADVLDRDDNQVEITVVYRDKFQPQVGSDQFSFTIGG